MLIPAEEIVGISLSTTTLNFATNYSEFTFNISNIGTSGAISWTIGDISVGWISVMPQSGSVAMGQSASIKVCIDHSKILASESTFITINAAGGSQSIMVMVEKAGSGSSGGSGGGDGSSAMCPMDSMLTICLTAIPKITTHLMLRMP